MLENEISPIHIENDAEDSNLRITVECKCEVTIDGNQLFVRFYNFTPDIVKECNFIGSHKINMSAKIVHQGTFRSSIFSHSSIRFWKENATYSFFQESPNAICVVWSIRKNNQTWTGQADIITSTPLDIKDIRGSGGFFERHAVRNELAATWPGMIMVKKGIMGPEDNADLEGKITGHAIIVSNDPTIIVEAVGYVPLISGEVIKTPLQQWLNEELNNGSEIFVVWAQKKGIAMSDSGKVAATYAESKIRFPYNWDFINRQTIKNFYCSQLCWRAWKEAGYELDDAGDGIIQPRVLTQEEKNAMTLYSIKR